MRFTPEDLKELEPFINEAVARKTANLQKKVDLLTADIGALRKTAYHGDEA